MSLERAIDVIVLGILIVLMVRAPSDFIKVASLVAAVLLMLGSGIALRRRK